MPENAETEESQKWLTEFRKQRAMLAKLDRQEREGELLPADQVTFAWGQFVNACRNRLLSIKSKCGPLVYEYLTDPDQRQEILEIIDSNIREALIDLSNFELE